jgi:hypothetical protein
MSIDKLDRLHDVYIAEYLQALNCPRALTIYLMWSHKEHKQLVDLSFNPLDYQRFEDARDSLAATKFLSKAKFLNTLIDVKKVAMDGFFEAERVCVESNERIRGQRFKNPLTSAVLLGMTFKISNILTKFSADELVDSSNWGPGSTTLLRRAEATYPKKFSVERKITAGAYGFVKDWFHLAYPSWDMTFEIDSFSKVVTVDKNAKTDRVIAIEPGINLWFQKGIGTMMKERLKRHGVDLTDQTVNQERSRIASKFNNLATVDFSMASDTIAFALVEEVLPRDWFCLLRSFRTPSARVDGKEIHFAKFSSMGNGFTFELESLLFYTMAIACCESLGIDAKGTSVFGDDVVLPSAAYDLFCSVSADLGFKVNTSKSYDDGAYRESCGSHYWYGYSIKPIFHKESFDGQQSVIKAANLLRNSNRTNNLIGSDKRFRRGWQLLVDYLGPKCPRVPASLGDLGINETFVDSSSYRRSPGHGYEGYFIHVYAVQSLNLEVYGKGLLLSKLKLLGGDKNLVGRREIDDLQDLAHRCSGNHIPLPGRIRYARKRILIPQWDCIGDWD